MCKNTTTQFQLLSEMFVLSLNYSSKLIIENVMLEDSWNGGDIPLAGGML